MCVCVDCVCPHPFAENDAWFQAFAKAKGNYSALEGGFAYEALMVMRAYPYPITHAPVCLYVCM